MTFDVRRGDCVELMAAMPAGSVDAVVCDPPYGLEFMGKEWDSLAGRTPPASAVTETRGFVPGRGRGIDARHRARILGAENRNAQEWHQAWATEALRVLKPGGHLLAFGGTRTYHRLACAVEDAGFEIRDTIAYMYGSGFPKSLNVSKAIDRAGGDSPEKQAGVLRSARERAGMSREHVAEAVGCTESSVRDWEEGRRRAVGAALEFLVPSPDYRARLADLLGYTADERVIVGVGGGSRSLYESGHRGVAYGAPATPEAERWEGWGTALKPAHEPVVVARKPLSGTVAANCLEHGTGALNVDGCRVGTEGATTRSHQAEYGESGWRTGHEIESVDAGRWPANVVLSHMEECVPVGTRKVKGVQQGAGSTGFGVDRDDGYEKGTGRVHAPDAETTSWRCHPDCPVRLLDEQTGERPSSSPGVRSTALGMMNDDGWQPRDTFKQGYEDVGGASRFFYVAKASRGERNAGLEGFEETESPTMCSQPTGAAHAVRSNVHPTVKPISLMRWLVRLVTPPEGTVLDPFCGSGSTGAACMLEGFDFVGLEREAEYVRIAQARIAWWLKHRGDGEAAEILAAGEARDEVEATGQLGMFD